jgi:uridine nucleosidase
MIPINVTHTAIATSAIQSQLHSSSGGLRHTLSTLITYFADSYKSTFGFEDGPPLHDALTIAFVSRPDLFSCQRYRVDVELGGTHTSGETVVDIWNYRSCDESWGPVGKNCLVAKSVNVITPCKSTVLFILLITVSRWMVSSTCFSNAWTNATRCLR